MVSDLKTFANKGCKIAAQKKVSFSANFALVAGFFWSWCYYPHWLRDFLSPICGIYFICFSLLRTNQCVANVFFLWQMNIQLYFWPQNFTNICWMIIFVNKYLNIKIYIKIFIMYKFEKVNEWMSKYILGPKILQLFLRMNLLIKLYFNTFEYPNICYTLGQTPSTFSQYLHKVILHCNLNNFAPIALLENTWYKGLSCLAQHAGHRILMKNAKI